MDELLAYGRCASRIGAQRFWMGQSMQIETFLALSYLAGSGVDIPMGTSVALTPLRHPYTAAVEARSIAALTGRPAVIGVGPGYPGWVRLLNGRPYRSGRAATVEYVSLLRALLSGEVVRHDGEYFRLHDKLPEMPSPPVEVGAGVLRPRMARAMGGVADVAITLLTPLAFLTERILPELREGAEEAGRPVPRVASTVHVALKRPRRDPRRLAQLGAGTHLRLPHYVDMLNKAGIDADLLDPVSSARMLVESGVFVTGTADEVVEQLNQYTRCGVDEIILNTTGVLAAEGMDAALTDLEEITEAMEKHNA